MQVRSERPVEATGGVGVWKARAGGWTRVGGVRGLRRSAGLSPRGGAAQGAAARAPVSASDSPATLAHPASLGVCMSARGTFL